jgi:hypothetical protein
MHQGYPTAREAFMTGWSLDVLTSIGRGRARPGEGGMVLAEQEFVIRFTTARLKKSATTCGGNSPAKPSTSSSSPSPTTAHHQRTRTPQPATRATARS